MVKAEAPLKFPAKNVILTIENLNLRANHSKGWGAKLLGPTLYDVGGV